MSLRFAIGIEGMHLKGAHRASHCQACHQPNEWPVFRHKAGLVCHPGKGEQNSSIWRSNCHLFP